MHTHMDVCVQARMHTHPCQLFKTRTFLCCFSLTAYHRGVVLCAQSLSSV